MIEMDGEASSLTAMSGSPEGLTIDVTVELFDNPATGEGLRLRLHLSAEHVDTMLTQIAKNRSEQAEVLNFVQKFNDAQGDSPAVSFTAFRVGDTVEFISVPGLASRVLAVKGCGCADPGCVDELVLLEDPEGFEDWVLANELRLVPASPVS